MRAAFRLLALNLLLLLPGCQGEPDGERLAVSGEITLDGQAIDLALVRFIGKVHQGDVVTSVRSGQFRLDQESGLFPGDYAVVVTPVLPELPQAIASIEAGERDPLKSREIPSRYQIPGNLHATVKADGANHYRFKLTKH